MNGDGKDDIVTRLTAGARVFFGQDIVPDTPDAVLNFPGCPDGAVQEIQSVGDFNHDRYDDIILISQTCNNSWGKMALYLGSPWVNPNPVFQIEGRDPPLNLVGIFTSEPLGDVNGDGVDDFAVGCVNTNNDGRRGRVVIFAGDTTYIVPIGKVGPAVPDQLSLSIYPNPVNGVATFDISSQINSGPLGVIVYNLLGQTVDRIILNANLQTRYLYNTSRLASGHYIVQAYTNTNFTTQKLVVLK
ncbi:FG-GAP repeat protein [bacterium]|nr:FG-GAP repeat protein [bacterium]